MSLLNADIQRQVVQEFADLVHPVKLVVFTQEFECQYCRETRSLVEEVAALSDILSVEVHTFHPDAEPSQTYGIDKIPAVAVVAGGDDAKDYGIRFYGIPSGYEFTSFLEAILLVGTGTVELDQETMAFLDTLDTPLHLQVFVTPTCPYCPRAVTLAHNLAYVSNKITADMVEVTEFPHLGNRYQVMGVPRTVIGEEVYVEGAVPERMLLEKLKAAALRS